MNWQLADKLLRNKGARLVSTIFGWEIKENNTYYKIHPKVAKAIIKRDLVVIADKNSIFTSYRHKYEKLNKL